APPAKKAAAKAAAKATAKAAAKAAPKAAKTKAAAKKPAAAKSRSKAVKVADVLDDETSHENGNGAAHTGKALVIVESPAKAKTIGKYLGSGYSVKATVGHIRDLPIHTLGLALDDGFAPAVFIATDPDREGEAIAWHVQSQIKGNAAPPIRRVRFHESRREAVTRA